MKFRFLLLFALITSFSYSLNNLTTIDSLEKKPKTYKQAVDYVYNLLSEEDKEYVKNVPFNDLIIFHRGWGMGIRNGVGLWSDNIELLQSCAKEIGKERIHPENASQLIIEGVWKKLNMDIGFIDFSKLEPIDYFKAIHNTLEKAKSENNNRYMLSLPSWVYESWQYWDDEERWLDLNLEAKNLMNTENKLSDLALLFLSQSNENLNIIDGILKGKIFNVVNDDIQLPEFSVDRQEKTASTKLNSLSSQNFALLCYGKIFDKTFSSIADYNQWMQLRNDNYLMHWKYYYQGMTTKDFKILLSEPRKFLEILILTGKYFHKDTHNSELINSCGSRYKDVLNLADYLKIDSLYADFPYAASMKIGRYPSSNPDYDKDKYRSIHTLAKIADSLSVDELFKILKSNSISHYNNTLKTKDLLEYKYLIGFLLATQGERIIAHSNKTEVFEILKYYWEKEFISWAIRYYISELLIQIDSIRAQQLFLSEFEFIPETGSFTRNAIIRTLIKFDFNGNKEFIYDWYWKIQNKEFKTMPREWDLVLSLLKDTNQETKKLYIEIVNDSRFSRKEFFKN